MRVSIQFMLKTLKLNKLLMIFCLLTLANISHAQCTDTSPTGDCDGDSIQNSVDLDDDNDGILDSIEGVCTSQVAFDWDTQTVSNTIPSSTSSTVNNNLITVNFSGNGWGASNPSISTGGNARRLFDDEDVNGTGTGDNTILITRSDNGDVYNISTENNQINTDVVFTVPVDGLKLSFADIDFSDFVSIYAVDVNNNTVFPNYSSPSGFLPEWDIFEPTDPDNPVPNRRTVVGNGQNTNTAGSTAYVDFDANSQITQLFIRTGYLDTDGFYDIPDTGSTPTGGNQTNSFILAGDYIFCSSPDADGDNIPDYLDTDSDNDGCPDAIEAAGNFTVSNLVNFGTDGDAGVDNSFGDTVETNPSSPNYGVPIVNGATTQQATTAAVTDDSDSSACATVDLSINKTVNDATPNIGDEVTFTLLITNLGPNAATDVTVNDVVPPGFVYTTGSMTGGDAINESTPATGNGLLWTINNLAISPATGSSTTLTFKAVVNAP